MSECLICSCNACYKSTYIHKSRWTSQEMEAVVCAGVWLRVDAVSPLARLSLPPSRPLSTPPTSDSHVSVSRSP